MKRQKILIDTDIGDDIDDAVAIALGLKSENIEIIGITTVFRDTFSRARIAGRLLALAGKKEIPVYAGSRNGISEKYSPKPLCQMTASANVSEYDPVNADDESGEKAVDFILSAAKKYKKELIILGIGPYTNLAKAFLKDSEAMNGVEKIVVMGGTYGEHHLEWNVLCDVEAAEILFDSCRNLYCVGYDVTKQALVSWQEHQEMMKPAEGVRGYLAELVKKWSEHCWHAPVFHDALALYYISDPSVLMMKRAEIKVETKGEYTRGMTVNIDNYSEGRCGYRSVGKTHIAVAVDAAKLKEIVMEKLFSEK